MALAGLRRGDFRPLASAGAIGEDCADRPSGRIMAGAIKIGRKTPHLPFVAGG
jgi:hypothetical protein